MAAINCFNCILFNGVGCGLDMSGRVEPIKDCPQFQSKASFEPGWFLWLKKYIPSIIICGIVATIIYALMGKFETLVNNYFAPALIWGLIGSKGVMYCLSVIESIRSVHKKNIGSIIRIVLLILLSLVGLASIVLKAVRL